MTMTVHADNMTLNLRGAVTQKHKARSVFVGSGLENINRIHSTIQVYAKADLPER